MFNAFERAVAGRYLRARRGERFVSVIAIFSLVGIALGVATLIIVMSVMNGFRIELMGRILGLNGHLGVYGAGAPITQYEEMLPRIRAVPGVVSAVPVVEGQGLIDGGRGGYAFALVRGIGPADLRAMRVVSDHIVAGTLERFSGEDVMAVGVGMARRLGIAVGSRVNLISPNKGAATVIGTIPRIKSYKVVAIFQVGFNEADTSFVFMPLEAAQLYFRLPGAASQIEVISTDPDHISAVNAGIRHVLAGAPVQVFDWTQANNSLFAAVEVERNVMFLILTLIILVAAFNVISSLIMMVKDKTRDIAVLRTLGAGQGAIMRIFLLCGASVGIAGTLLGTGIGIVFCLNIERIRHVLESLTGTNLFNPEIYYLSHLPAVLQWQEVVQVVAMALVLSLLATLYPSWRAARTDPVEALRHE